MKKSLMPMKLKLILADILKLSMLIKFKGRKATRKFGKNLSNNLGWFITPPLLSSKQFQKKNKLREEPKWKKLIGHMCSGPRKPCTQKLSAQKITNPTERNLPLKILIESIFEVQNLWTICQNSNWETTTCGRCIPVLRMSQPLEFRVLL